MPDKAEKHSSQNSPCESCVEEETISLPKKICFAAGAAFFLCGLLLPLTATVKFAVFFASYLLVGGEVLLRAVRNLLKGRVFDENFLMSVATIGAFCIGEYAEGAAVMLFYQIGEFFEDRAVEHSRKSIAALMNIRPDYANRKVGDILEKVSPEDVRVGERILVRPGEKIPLDGTVEDGASFVDTSALTGEPVPRSAEPGSEVLSGTVNQSGVLTIRVTKEFGESTVTKILDLVQNASSHKAPTENFITKFSKIYTPIVVGAAVLLAVIPPLVFGLPFSEWLSRALTFLVVSCPCALVISIPLSFFAGIGRASRNGILVKGSNYLDALNHVDTIVFDKTGTLTKGRFEVTKVNAVDGNVSKLLELAAHAELYSSHPIAVSVRRACKTELDPARVSDYEELSGRGVRVHVDGRTVLAGSEKLMQEQGIPFQKEAEAGTVIYLAVDGKFAGSILIADEVKPDSAKTILGLRDNGIHTVMLTGDSRAAGEAAAQKLGVEKVFAELLPQQKVEQMEHLAKQISTGGKLVFVGDGINDAPVLARADVGIAMGGIGSDAAIEAADVVLMTDEPSKILTAIQTAKKTGSVVRQNILFALGVKIAILILAAFGMATMWEAVFGDVGVTLIAVLNSIRASGGKSRN